MNLTKNEDLTKGAEAIISRGTFLELPIIIKHRVPKLYRHSRIDSMIRLHRIRAEAKVMTLAWKIGVNVPSLIGIDIQNYSLFIELIQGELLYDVLETTPMKELSHSMIFIKSHPMHSLDGPHKVTPHAFS